MSDEVKIKLVAGIVLIVLCFFISKGCDEAQWNDGHCPNCGTAWTYEQAVGHRFTTNYIYACDKCGRRIELCYTHSEEDNVEDDIEDDIVEE